MYCYQEVLNLFCSSLFMLSSQELAYSCFTSTTGLSLVLMLRAESSPGVKSMMAVLLGAIAHRSAIVVLLSKCTRVLPSFDVPHQIIRRRCHDPSIAAVEYITSLLLKVLPARVFHFCREISDPWIRDSWGASGASNSTECRAILAALEVFHGIMSWNSRPSQFAVRLIQIEKLFSYFLYPTFYVGWLLESSERLGLQKESVIPFPLWPAK